MAKEVGAVKPEPTMCTIGYSYNRKGDPHEAGKTPKIWCYRCGSIMGCSRCCEKPNELICLKCHNWATKAGLRRHGNICVSAKVPAVRTDNGWKYWKPNEGQSTERKLAEIVKSV